MKTTAFSKLLETFRGCPKSSLNPVVVNPEVLEDVARVLRHADRNRVTLEEMQHMARGTLPAVGDDPGHVCVIPRGYRCVFGYEQQPEFDTWWRHLSVSVSEGIPSVGAVAVIAELFGCTKFGIPEAESRHVAWLEEQYAVNYLEEIA